MKCLGICIGASTIGMILLRKDQTGVKILNSKSTVHEGNPRSALEKLIDESLLHSVDRIAVTGRKFRNMLKASSISEPEAVEYAYSHISKEDGKASLIVSAGGETFITYKLDNDGRIIDVNTSGKCASGTGEFFLQQLKRMDMTVDEAINSANLDHPYKVAGRCSVFCKSDCTHALNKGVPKEDVVAGLCQMMADKIHELSKKNHSDRVFVIGGTSANTIMLHYLKKNIPHIHVPQYANVFEALGAALWASEHETLPASSAGDLLNHKASSFSYLTPLSEAASRVVYNKMDRQKAQKGDRCILGLDVGSTTTKAVIVREDDRAILASCYLRTNGDPVNASIQCYESLSRQINEEIEIRSLGVTGSGRQIAGLHALTPAVINEIIAHAAAAVYFDPEVDTIFEIGGQDAKYTYITNGVASDYAMNEACSAGTGSFLEEAAKECLGIDTEEIGTIAMQSRYPLDFSDQCAAFINSDIKNAIQENMEIPDIAAGLVYSICMNYINRVKGSRRVGEKVFMQGGVCYNMAVPAAMAALIGKTVIVPPEPGLMGAFGAALDTADKLENGLLKPMHFDLKELSQRKVTYKKPFVCAGGPEKCDRKCIINRILIKEKIYPFGGACNRYYNLLHDTSVNDTAELDLVQLRQKLVFDTFSVSRAKSILPANGQVVGINNSLMTNTLYPMYYNFFTALGYKVVLADAVEKEGTERRGADFCYPMEISHGSMANLINKKPDIYFLPHVKSMSVDNGIGVSTTCPFVQSEPYVLKTAFKELGSCKILNPVLDFTKGYKSAEKTFIQIGRELGFDRLSSCIAFDVALQVQNDFHKECLKIGRKFLDDIENSPHETGIVLFGRPYNAFASFANMGIPHKFASRGYRIIPYDFLPLANEEPMENMYWGMGQLILKAAGFVKKHPRLFGVYITNFSCGPDSFLLTYFRDLMGQKPSLTLELDSHSADAGVDTRIEAFLDVVKSFIEIGKNTEIKSNFQPADTFLKDKNMWVKDSRGNNFPITDPRVHVLIPSMGDVGAKLLASTFKFLGINATALPTPEAKELKTGKGYSSCKECLPLMLTIGSLMEYLKCQRSKDEIIVYFMPETSGPCRFGQYNTLMKNVVKKHRLEDVAFISMSSENGYAGFGTRFALRAWHAIILSGILDEIRSAILVLAKDREKALAVYREVCAMIEHSMAHDSLQRLKTVLQNAAVLLKNIEKKGSIDEIPKAALIGEIYVRQDQFSRKNLEEKLAERNIMLKIAPVEEWFYYCDYIIKKKLLNSSTLFKQINASVQGVFKGHFERSIKEIFSQTGLYEFRMMDVKRVVENASDLLSPKLTGEAILTIGGAVTEVLEDAAGVIAIGPFGCMPSRIAEAVTSESINDRKLQAARDKQLVEKILAKYPYLPFISIETDGNVFPQVVESRLEAFCLQVERIHRELMMYK